MLLTAQATLALILGDGDSRLVPSALPEGLVTVLGTRIPADRFWLAGIVVLAAAGPLALYRWPAFGLATRAASENEASAMLAGLPTDRLAAGNAALAAAVAGGMGILAASITQIDTVNLPLQVVPAVGAALFARFTSFAITCVAGLLIGVAQSLLYLAQTQSWFPTLDGVTLPGVDAVLTFLVIVAALWLRGSPLPRRGELAEAHLPHAPRPVRVAGPALVFAVVVVVALFTVPFDLRYAIGVSLAGTVIGLAFVLVTGYVGQVSLLVVPLAGVAAYATSHLLDDAGVGFPFAGLLGVAIANFGFANSTWGVRRMGDPIPEPTLFGMDVGAVAGLRAIGGGLVSPALGLWLLAVVLATGLLVVRVRRSGLGSRMLAVRSNEAAAAAAGVSVPGTKFAAYVLSSCIAGIGGVAYAYARSKAIVDSFGILVALQFAAFAYVGGITVIPGALVTGLMAPEGVVPFVLHAGLGLSQTWIVLVAGLALTVCIVLFPAGIAGSRRRPRRRSGAETLKRSHRPIAAKT